MHMRCARCRRKFDWNQAPRFRSQVVRWTWSHFIARTESLLRGYCFVVVCLGLRRNTRSGDPRAWLSPCLEHGNR